jgi:DNA-binding response OmpR family regulator/DNA-binding transcriptional regulator YhcF (GntR family)
MSAKVLIIEDNNDIRENIAEILLLGGYTVYEAENGKIGLALANKHRPDLILCDIMMPELDGYGVLSILSRNIATSTIPFIFLTAKTEHLDQRKGMEMGADDYLTKPFNRTELLNAVEVRLKKNVLLQSVYCNQLDQIENLIARKDGLLELKLIIRERKTRAFKKNQVIYYEGDQSNGLHLLISGSVKTVLQTEGGRELITCIYVADDYLGINAALAGETYIDTAIALEAVELCVIPALILDQLLTTYLEVGRSFIRLLSKDTKEKEEQLLQLAYNSVRRKIADAILRLHRKQSAEETSLKISRENLAAMSGMAAETVSRTLSDFVDEGIIAKIGNIISILELQRLIKMRN